MQLMMPAGLDMACWWTHHRATADVHTAAAAEHRVGGWKVGSGSVAPSVLVAAGAGVAFAM